MPLEVACPTCKKTVVWHEASQYRPFCCKRCQLIDIGDWADENHKISQPVQGAVELNEEMLDALEEEFLQHNKFFVEPD